MARLAQRGGSPAGWQPGFGAVNAAAWVRFPGGDGDASALVVVDRGHLVKAASPGGFPTVQSLFSFATNEHPGGDAL